MIKKLSNRHAYVVEQHGAFANVETVLSPRLLRRRTIIRRHTLCLGLAAALVAPASAHAKTRCSYHANYSPVVNVTASHTGCKTAGSLLTEVELTVFDGHARF